MNGQASCHSAVYFGTIQHRRHEPLQHSFGYPLCLAYLDLNELEPLFRRHWYTSLERWNIVSFYRGDFLQTGEQTAQKNDSSVTSLKSAVIEYVKRWCAEEGIDLPEVYSVRLLTHLRYFGFVFNPVSFYYCFGREGELLAIVAEITNTPWGERFAYVLPLHKQSQRVRYHPPEQNVTHKIHRFDFSKNFHVSPFNPMEMNYDWRLSEPDAKLTVHMNLYRLQGAGNLKSFDATLVLQRKPFSKGLRSAVIRYPLMPVTVITGIYWQAFKLWCKRSPFYDHPASSAKTRRFFS